jgi:hypothetical protein
MGETSDLLRKPDRRVTQFSAPARYRSAGQNLPLALRDPAFLTGCHFLVPPEAIRDRARLT